MTFTAFQEIVNGFIMKAGGGISADFYEDDGKFTARCSEGTTLIGNSVSGALTVRWGSGHEAVV